MLDPGTAVTTPVPLAPNGTKEKDIALLVAMAVGHRLREAGIKTAMTRATDTFVSLADRTTLANKRGDVLLQVARSATNRKLLVEVFHYPGSQEVSSLSFWGNSLPSPFSPKAEGLKMEVFMCFAIPACLRPWLSWTSSLTPFTKSCLTGPMF